MRHTSWARLEWLAVGGLLAGALACDAEDLPPNLRFLAVDGAEEPATSLQPESGELDEQARRRTAPPKEPSDVAKAPAGSDEPASPATPEVDRRSRRRAGLPNVEYSALHQSATVVDMHVDGLWYTHSRKINFSDFGENRQAHPHQIRNGHVDAVFFSIWVPPDKGNPAAEARALVEKFQKEALGRTDVKLALTADDIDKRANARGVTALLGLEGAAALDGKPENVDWFIDQGVRYVSLTWNEKNPFATGAKAGDEGLSAKGRALVQRLNKRGVMVDVSHGSPRTFWDVATLSQAPFIASHSNARAVCNHARNLDDLQLYAVREAGGVVGLNFYRSFLVESGDATVEDVMAHLLHMRAVMGIGHIGIGSDYDGDITPPTDMRDIGWMSRLTQRMVQEGFSEDDVLAVLGGNVIRAMRSIQSGAMERHVEHRPAQVRNLGDAALSDARFRTTWSPDQPGATTRLEVKERGLARVTIWTSTPFGHSGVKKLTVKVDCGAGCGGTKTVQVDGRPQPIRIDFPDAAKAERSKVEVTVDAFDGNGKVAEIVPELHVDPR